MRFAKTTMLSVLVAVAAADPGAAEPVGTAFSYQGRLASGGAPVSGVYDLQLTLFDAEIEGGQVGPTVVVEDVTVTAGSFTVQPDFGDVFDGEKRWLETGLRPGDSTGEFTPVVPRQELTPVPHALVARKVPWEGVTDKPEGLADDTDDDALGALVCGEDQVARWNGAAWVCSGDREVITHDTRVLGGHQ